MRGIISNFGTTTIEQEFYEIHTYVLLRNKILNYCNFAIVSNNALKR